MVTRTRQAWTGRGMGIPPPIEGRNRAMAQRGIVSIGDLAVELDERSGPADISGRRARLMPVRAA